MQLLKQYYLRLLGKKDYSYKELFNKGILKGYSEKDILEVLNWLLELNYLNDARLAENLVNHYQGKKGSTWIKQKALSRGIQEDLVEQFLNTTQDILDSKLLQKIAKKYHVNNWQEVDFKTKQKIFSWASRNGYSTEIINKLFQNTDYL